MLATNDLTGARDSFASAVAVAPDDACANALLGATRLLCLAEQPAGKAVLAQLGLVVTNRGLCGWMAYSDELLPNGLASELVPLVAAKALEDTSAGAANLARVLDTNFTLLLDSNETATVEVTIDYGDLLVLRSVAEFGKYACYALQGANGGARANALRSLATGGPAGTPVGDRELETLLDPPRASDAMAASLALSNAATLYLTGSDMVRSRATNDVRLFNYDPRKAEAEGRFRERLKSLVRLLDTAARKRFRK